MVLRRNKVNYSATQNKVNYRTTKKQGKLFGSTKKKSKLQQFAEQGKLLFYAEAS